MVIIDGSFGEGGGQILRTSVALSLVTGTPFKIQNIRAKRDKPGLLRQHLTAVNAAAEIGDANVTGNAIGSSELTFSPKKIKDGEFTFSVGTAGSTTLVLQTILPALFTANGPSKLTLEGGTHNPFAPPFDFLARAFLPIVNQIGPKVSATLERAGFYPAGGGKFTFTIEPCKKLSRIDLLERGEIVAMRAKASVAQLPTHIAHRELDVISKKLSMSRESLFAEEVKGSLGPGNIVTIEVESKNITEVFTGFGERGISAEHVATKAADEARKYLLAEVPVGEHLADQLLLPMALAGGGSFKTLSPSAHTTTNIEIIKSFLPVNISISQDTDTVYNFSFSIR